MSRRPARHRRWCLLLVPLLLPLLLVLGACGRDGPLRLPDPPPADPTEAEAESETP